MKNIYIKTKPIIYLLLDILLFPVTIISVIVFKIIRKGEGKYTPLSLRIFRLLGSFPIRNHYYEPKFKYSSLEVSKLNKRELLGIDLNVFNQLELLRNINYKEELLGLPYYKKDKFSFGFSKRTFSFGDAEVLYSFIRYFKPKRIIEIGSGQSTLIMLKAVENNNRENPKDKTLITCIEPYESEFLSVFSSINFIRRKVEDLNLDLFLQLELHDILFIDSSHIIKPVGDVLFEYLTLLPALKSGVLIHLHDIFTPNNYPKELLLDEVRLWNEQYLLEAFLTNNDQFEVICSLNYLYKTHPETLVNICPNMLNQITPANPGSFWIRKK